VPIITRNNCIYVTLGTCYSVWMTVWYAGWNENIQEINVLRKIVQQVGFIYNVIQGCTVNNMYVKKVCCLQVFLEQSWRTCDRW